MREIRSYGSVGERRSNEPLYPDLVSGTNAYLQCLDGGKEKFVFPGQKSFILKETSTLWGLGHSCGSITLRGPGIMIPCPFKRSRRHFMKLSANPPHHAGAFSVVPARQRGSKCVQEALFFWQERT